MFFDAISYLRGIESQKWGEILTDTSGRKNNTRNHGIAIDTLCLEAQTRASELKLDEFEMLISIAISSRARIWGILLDSVFFIVWFDPRHEVYPTSR